MANILPVKQVPNPPTCTFHQPHGSVGYISTMHTRYQDILISTPDQPPPNRDHWNLGSLIILEMAPSKSQTWSRLDFLKKERDREREREIEREKTRVKKKIEQN